MRAFARLHDRVAGGERFAVAEAADVGSIRSAAVRGIEAALADATYPRLVRHAMTGPAAMVQSADREFEDARDEVEPRWIARDVARYVAAGTIARGIPWAAERVATALADAT